MQILVRANKAGRKVLDVTLELPEGSDVAGEVANLLLEEGLRRGTFQNKSLSGPVQTINVGQENYSTGIRV